MAQQSNIEYLYSTSKNTDKIRVNDTWQIHKKNFIDIIKQTELTPGFSNFNNVYPVKTSAGNGLSIIELYQQGFLQVITETVCNYPVPFLTEKTIKPILAKRPFVMIGVVGSLSLVKSIGFKTFDQWWDESYDSIVNIEDRIVAVVDIIEQISKMSLKDIRLLCIEMKDVLEYNFNYYVNEFKKDQTIKFEQDCTTNLNRKCI